MQRRREALAEEKSEAYRWIREHTARDDRFIAYEDENLYLHTGRQALRPLAVSTASFYRQNKTILDRELEHLADTARVVGARYWLVAPDDFHLESGDEFLQKATSGLLDQAPAVFATPGGRVRIYDISALTGSGASSSERSCAEDGSEAKRRWSYRLSQQRHMPFDLRGIVLEVYNI
jgi:hypothetical protein